MTTTGTVVLDVYVDLAGETVRAGTAYVSERRRSTSTSFTYADAFLARTDAYAISPDLPVTVARHQVDGLPGTFADTAPDRWGRNLIEKKVRRRAREGGALPAVREVDYLVGVSDLTRQGALRYTGAGDDLFLAPDPDVPRIVELPRLLRAADAVASGDEDYAEVKLLLDAGTGSLGGARPKASVRDGGRLLIAKFPHPGDRWDVMAWEKVVLDLADEAGIRVPRRRLVTVEGRSVLLLERFDRSDRGRVGYASALSLVGGRDGASYDYLEVAEALATHGAAVGADLRELWLRVLLSVAVNNTDDHLRNHGFLRAGGGWRLAPAFDVNPDPDARAAATSVGFVAEDRAARFDALLELAPEFGVTAQRAGDEVRVVADVVSRWRDVASVNGIGEAEQRTFADVLDGGPQAR